MLKTAILFQNRMVIQREKKVSIWGWADPFSIITVSCQGIDVGTKAGEDGYWLIETGPFRTSECEEMIISSGVEKIRINDIAVGEVWLAGGQSNMEFHMRYDADMEAEKANVETHIRFFDYPEVSYPEEIDEADYSRQYGFWRECTADQLERFSAVGYYFAKKLYEDFCVPVGIIGCNWGGTPACAWMPEEAIIQCGGSAWIDSYNETVNHLDVDRYIREYKSKPSNFKVDQLADPMSDILVSGFSSQEILERAAAIGVTDADMNPVTGPLSERRPTGLYHSMLKPLAPYSIRGVIWYQGEADDEKAEIYDRIFPALIQSWRKLWSEDLPFLFVQLAPFRQWLGCKGTRYPEIRAAQQWTADNVPKTAMAVITDSGMEYDIHPKKKQPVGERLALLAERYVYLLDVLCEAPRMCSARIRDGSVILQFDYSGEGLRLEGNLLNALEVFQNGYPVAYEACEAQGNTVIVYGSNIRLGFPTEVRLGWTDYYKMNLYNSAGIPARPSLVVAEDNRET